MRSPSRSSLMVALLPLSALMALGAAASAPPRPAQTPTAKPTPVSFREEIEPFLKANCSSCHSAEQKSGGFVVETVAELRKGGTKSGAKIIIPGKASQSALIAYLRGTRQPRMPLNRPAVSEAQIKKVEAWINQGATIDVLKLGFPYTPPAASVAVPKVKNTAWVRNPIDNFVLAKLEAKGLAPAPPAAKTALLRRVYADLVGEPPSPEEADQFFRDTAPDAYEKLIDRLLADPRYGERWGRHWLDLARYSETHGFERDSTRPRAWRYRDYVIRSFNADKPYDRFLKEQLAGDELYPEDPDAIVATGFARLGPWDELSADGKQRWQDYLNDATDTTGSVMLGMTVGCARCHDHKYDRITQADYYRLQAFFVGTKWTNTPLPPTADPEAIQKRVTDAHSRMDSLKKQMQDLRAQVRTKALAAKNATKVGGTSDITDQEVEDFLKNPAQKTEHDQLAKLEGERDRIDDGITPYEPVAETISDSGPKAPPQYLLLRGNLVTPGAEVKPGFVAAMCAGGEEKPAAITAPANGKSTGRRTALAEWIASPSNPLTARVMVNRVWQHHFGRGIAGNPSDFGLNGEKPTHPELLDYLAVRFMKEGWSVKKMHRLMLTSSAYRQSTAPNAKAAKLDPTNTLFWRMNRLRLEGEALRDGILTVSGRLNPQAGGPSVYPEVSPEVLATGSTHKWGASPEDQQRRRTVYVFQRRSLMLPIVEVFDGADMSNTCPKRSTTTIAPQALALFNGEFGRVEAGYFAERVIKEAGEDRNKQIARAYRIALCRTPSPAQLTQAQNYLTRKAQMYLTEQQKPVAANGNVRLAADTPSSAAQLKAEKAALTDFCHVLINTNEFLYLD
jgi:mono/diheme cytochrome c family protein